VRRRALSPRGAVAAAMLAGARPRMRPARRASTSTSAMDRSSTVQRLLRLRQQALARHGDGFPPTERAGAASTSLTRAERDPRASDSRPRAQALPPEGSVAPQGARLLRERDGRGRRSRAPDAEPLGRSSAPSGSSTAPSRSRARWPSCTRAESTPGSTSTCRRRAATPRATWPDRAGRGWAFPTGDYYFLDDARTKAIREAYRIPHSAGARARWR
jgi:hypothetical protein